VGTLDVGELLRQMVAFARDGVARSRQRAQRLRAAFAFVARLRSSCSSVCTRAVRLPPPAAARLDVRAAARPDAVAKRALRVVCGGLHQRVGYALIEQRGHRGVTTLAGRGRGALSGSRNPRAQTRNA